MNRKAVTQSIGIAVVGMGMVGGLAAWANQPEVIPEWSHGEFRVALEGLNMRFIQSGDSEYLTPPNEVRRSLVQSKLYFLNRLTAAGWELVDVDQTEQDWVYLMRRPNRVP